MPPGPGRPPNGRKNIRRTNAFFLLAEAFADVLIMRSEKRSSTLITNHQAPLPTSTRDTIRMNATSTESNGIHRTRLFSGICLALIPTGAAFGLISSVMNQLKTEFVLTNGQVGAIGGAAVWGMALSLLFIGPFLEAIGMKRATWMAFLAQFAGLTVMISALFFTNNPAAGFWVLMIGAALLAGGNGMIEVAGNPLTAALYPEQKAHKLNIFHAFFPLAILVASVIGFYLDKTTPGSLAHHWAFRLALVYIPIILYGILVLPQKFPKTENAEAGLPVKDMFQFTLTSPLMYAILIIFALAISIEMAINRWLPPIFSTVGANGNLLLAWISFVMMVLRFFSGPVISSLSPPGMLSAAAIFTAIGVYLFGTASSVFLTFVGATFFGIGITYFFPTVVGLVSERLPRTGSLGIVLTCGVGLGAAGFIGMPGIGIIVDKQLTHHLSEEREVATMALMEAVAESYPAYRELAAAAEDSVTELGYVDADIGIALNHAELTLASYEAAGGDIVDREAALALRAIANSAGGADEAARDRGAALLEAEAPDAAAIKEFAAGSAAQASLIAGSILNAAEGVAGQRGLSRLAWLPLILTTFFGLMYLNDRRKGGYKAIRLERTEKPLDKVADDVGKPMPSPGGND